MYHNILIATDGLELSARAVEHGVGLARAVGAKVTFLTVTESFHVFSFNADQIEDTRLDFVEHMNARAEHTLAAAGNVPRPTTAVSGRCATGHSAGLTSSSAGTVQSSTPKTRTPQPIGVALRTELRRMVGEFQLRRV